MHGIGLEEYLESHILNIQEHSSSVGYKKLENLIGNNYSESQKKVILTQYCAFQNNGNRVGCADDTVLKHILDENPDIISCIDLINEKKPFYKFIWTFFKKDENLIDDVFNSLSLTYKKYDHVFEENEFLIYIVNSVIDCDYNDDIFHTDSAHKVQQYGYLPFDIFRKKMILHGMCWYIYGNPDTNFVDLCRLFGVRRLAIGEDDNWSNVGYREDLQLGFRSSWEANIARILNYKGISWKYEEESYELKAPKYYKTNNINGSIGYVPDFVLEDDTIIEVKGFWDNRSKLNVSQFMEQYPDKKYLVIDTDIYKCIAQKYKSVIHNWEDDKVDGTNDIIQVVGITIPQRVKAVNSLQIGDALEIVREPNNEYDSRAIRVNDAYGNQVGYFAKDCNSIYAPKMDMGFKYEVTVSKREPKVLQCKIKLTNKDDIIIPSIFM